MTSVMAHPDTVLGVVMLTCAVALLALSQPPRRRIYINPTFWQRMCIHTETLIFLVLLFAVGILVGAFVVTVVR